MPTAWCSAASCASGMASTCRAARASRRGACPCARRGWTRLPWWTRATVRSSGPLRPRAPTPPCTRARSTCMGQAYEVEELDLRNRRAVVQKFSGDWYTQPKKETDTWIEQVRDTRSVLGVELSFGIVSVTEEVVAFQKKRVADHEVLDLLPVDLPEQQFITQALWYELPEPLLREEFPLDVLQGSIHAAEHGRSRSCR